MEIERLSVIKPSLVAFCLRELREQRIHPTFAGYLCVKQCAAAEGRSEDLAVDFQEFFERFLSVDGGPANKPFVYPFTADPPTFHNLWFNRNVAGSYAPSSLRSQSPFTRVVEVTGSGSRAKIRYSLLDQHWQLARLHLTFENKVPAVPLAVFLYRDYALRTYPPSVAEWVRVFQEEFGYLDEDGEPNEEFDYLYVDESEHGSFEEWFE